MKRLHCFFILFLPLSFLSCKKFLTTTPADFASPLANYSTPKQLLTALAGVYDVLGADTRDMYADKLFNQLGACTDEGFYARAAGVTGPQVYNFDYTNPEIASLWLSCYRGIERANNLIANINVPTAMDPAERQAILGEALFLRGFFYFTLVSRWNDVPLRLEPTTVTGASSINVPATPAKEVYAQVIKDMTEAIDKCRPADFFNYSSRVSKTTVQGILARVTLTMAGYPLLDKSKYAEALHWANEVKNSGIHSLNPSYKQIFINQARNIYEIKESMWEADFSGNGTDIYKEEGRIGNTSGIAYSASNYPDTGYSYGFINATRKLHNLYGPGDLRRDWAISTYGYSGTNRVNRGTLIYDRNCGKWRRTEEIDIPKNLNYTPQNFPILRYADVLLMLAEADNQVNGPMPSPAAYDAINRVRRRGYGVPVDVPSAEADLPPGLDRAQFQLAIEDERARELCYETLRRPDLIRWGKWTTTMADLAAQMQTDLASQTSWKYAILGPTNAASSPKYLLYPIPSSEISVNKAIVQNPGY